MERHFRQQKRSSGRLSPRKRTHAERKKDDFELKKDIVARSRKPKAEIEQLSSSPATSTQAPGAGTACGVCFFHSDSGAFDNERLVACAKCGVAAHSSCCGAVDTDSNGGGDWACDLCKNNDSHDTTCAICMLPSSAGLMVRLSNAPENNSSSPPLTSTNKRKKLQKKGTDTRKIFSGLPRTTSDSLPSPLYVHLSCALFHHEVDDGGRFHPFVEFDDLEALSGARLSDAFHAAEQVAHTCYLCKTSSLGCLRCNHEDTGCQRWFHPTCALSSGMPSPERSFLPSKKPKQQLSSDTGHQKPPRNPLPRAYHSPPPTTKKRSAAKPEHRLQDAGGGLHRDDADRGAGGLRGASPSKDLFHWMTVRTGRVADLGDDAGSSSSTTLRRHIPLIRCHKHSSMKQLASPVARTVMKRRTDDFVFDGASSADGALRGTRCGVCFGAEDSTESTFIVCEHPQCEMVVHTKCYGIEEWPTGSWFCDACRSGARQTATCAVCPHSGGALKPLAKNGGGKTEKWIHVGCALMLVDSGAVAVEWEKFEFRLENEDVLRSSDSQECDACGGSTTLPLVNCAHSGCPKRLHAMCALSRSTHRARLSRSANSPSHIYCESHTSQTLKSTGHHSVNSRWRGLVASRPSRQRTRARELLSVSTVLMSPQSPMQGFFEGASPLSTKKKTRRKRTRSVTTSVRKTKKKWQRKLQFTDDALADAEEVTTTTEEVSVEIETESEYYSEQIDGDYLWEDEMRPLETPPTRRDHKNLIRSLEQLCLTRISYTSRFHSVVTKNLKLLTNEITYGQMVALLEEEFGKALIDRVHSQNYSSLLDKEGERALFLGDALMATRGRCTLASCQRESWLVSLCVSCGSAACQVEAIAFDEFLPRKKGKRKKKGSKKAAQKPVPPQADPHGGLTTAERCEESIVRALDYILQISRVELKKNAHRLLKTSGGDVIFLLKNVCVKARKESRVWKKARDVTLEIIEMFSSVDSLRSSAIHTDLLSYLEFLHGRRPLQPEFDSEPAKAQIRSALLNQQLEDILRFDPCEPKPVLTESNYCTQCNIEVKSAAATETDQCHDLSDSEVEMISSKQKRAKNSKKPAKPTLSRSSSAFSLHDTPKKAKSASRALPQCYRCHRPLRSTVHFDAVCLALIWLSVFEDCDITLKARNGTARLEDIVRYMPYLRPYRSMEFFGLAMFKFQCYFLTHLIFMAANGIEVDCWSDVRLDPGLFTEEFVFLVTNLKSVIKLDDPELVGEFLQCLRVFGMTEDNALMRTGVEYLLRVEERTKKGNFVKVTSFYTRYHAAYCGIIGLAHEGLFPYDDSVQMSKKWRSFEKYLLQPNTSILARRWPTMVSG